MRISDWSSDVCSSDLFDFILDLESFAPFNYQYILYGMEFHTDLSPVREDFPDIAEAERIFARLQSFGDRAASELPAHREMLDQINAGAAAICRSAARRVGKGCVSRCISRG